MDDYEYRKLFLEKLAEVEKKEGVPPEKSQLPKTPQQEIITMPRRKIEKLLRKGLLKREFVSNSIGIMTDPRITTGTCLKLLPDAVVVNPDSQEMMEEQIKKQGFPIRNMSRQEKRQMARLLEKEITKRQNVEKMLQRMKN